MSPFPGFLELSPLPPFPPSPRVDGDPGGLGLVDGEYSPPPLALLVLLALVAFILWSIFLFTETDKDMPIPPPVVLETEKNVNTPDHFNAGASIKQQLGRTIRFRAVGLFGTLFSAFRHRGHGACKKSSIYAGVCV
jgi:hypothetical protein